MPFRINRFEKGQFGFSFKFTKLFPRQPKLSAFPATRVQLASVLSSASETTEIFASILSPTLKTPKIDDQMVKKLETFIGTGEIEITGNNTKVHANFDIIQGIKRAIEVTAWKLPLVNRFTHIVDQIKTKKNYAEVITFLPNMFWGAINSTLNLSQMFFRLLTAPLDYAHRKIDELSKNSNLGWKAAGVFAQCLLFFPKQILHRTANVIGYATNLVEGILKVGLSTIKLPFTSIIWAISRLFSANQSKFTDLVGQELKNIADGLSIAVLNTLRLLPEAILLISYFFFPPVGAALNTTALLTTTALALAPASQLLSFGINESGYYYFNKPSPKILAEQSQSTPLSNSSQPVSPSSRATKSNYKPRRQPPAFTYQADENEMRETSEAKETVEMTTLHIDTPESPYTTTPTINTTSTPQMRPSSSSNLVNFDLEKKGTYTPMMFRRASSTLNGSSSTSALDQTGPYSAVTPHENDSRKALKDVTLDPVTPIDEREVDTTGLYS